MNHCYSAVIMYVHLQHTSALEVGILGHHYVCRCRVCSMCIHIPSMLHTCNDARSISSLTALPNTSLHLDTCCPPRDRPVSPYATRRNRTSNNWDYWNIQMSTANLQCIHTVHFRAVGNSSWHLHVGLPCAGRWLMHATSIYVCDKQA